VIRAGALDSGRRVDGSRLGARAGASRRAKPSRLGRIAILGSSGYAVRP
jgi:hypothetical protein